MVWSRNIRRVIRVTRRSCLAINKKQNRMFDKTYFVIMQNTNLNIVTNYFMVSTVVSNYVLYFSFTFILENNTGALGYIAYFSFKYLDMHNCQRGRPYLGPELRLFFIMKK